MESKNINMDFPLQIESEIAGAPNWRRVPGFPIYATGDSKDQKSKVKLLFTKKAKPSISLFCRPTIEGRRWEMCWSSAEEIRWAKECCLDQSQVSSFIFSLGDRHHILEELSLPGSAVDAIFHHHLSLHSHHWCQLHSNCDHYHPNDWNQAGAMCLREWEALQRPYHWWHEQSSHDDWGQEVMIIRVARQSVWWFWSGKRHLEPGAEGGEGDQEGGQVHVGPGLSSLS